MRRLILIRHANPAIDADLAPADWSLSETGIARARALAAVLSPGDATVVHTSQEPKAVQTARALAERWSLPVAPVAGLHEHERPRMPLLPPSAFAATIRAMFAHRSDVVFGSESADAAAQRFTAAVGALIAAATTDIVVVTHGTVLTLFVADVARVDAFEFWKSLDLPCAVTLSLPDLALQRITKIESRVEASPTPGPATKESGS